ncbi:MAG: RNA polymerase sigma factor [Clostridia bacterium]|nr:RNA polymerase sigma factor [Clostridia bacterium]
MDDKKIIELYFRRDEDAITQTKECYGERLKALAYRILRSSEDAEECENDTYMKAWESIPPQQPQHFFAYLAKICRNTALKMEEKQQAEKRSAVIVELSQELSECLPDKHSLEDTAEQELGEIISKFLKTVSKENRVIFIRRYFLSETISDISKALSISESKVKSSLFRTRNKLRDYLSKEELL